MLQAESGILAADRTGLASDQRTAVIGLASADNHTGSGIEGTFAAVEGIAATDRRELTQADTTAGCNRSDTKNTELARYTAASPTQSTAVACTTDPSCSTATGPFAHSDMQHHSLTN